MSNRPELRGRAARLARLFPTGPGQAARTPFVLLVVMLLGGGLIGLLVLNSALSEGSFQLDDLQRDTKSLTDEEQALQRDVDAYSAPDALQRRAQELGMVPGGDPAFLNPDGSVRGVPSAAAEQSSVSVPVIRPPEVLLPAPSPTPTGSQGPAGPPTPAETPAPTTSAVPTAAPEPLAETGTEPSPQPTQPATNPGR
ncbi:hypothetical protein [Streptomyces sp. NPDC020747]|uniref:hypothetical protein n=1 Tax=Streptomyces sp. NPDC020747 TaxID=3365086 RepID=UPI0037991F15